MFLTFLHQLFDSTHDLRGKDSGLGHRPAPKSQHSQRGAEFSEPKTAPDQRLQCAAREPSCTSLTGNSPQTHWHLPPKTCSVLLIRPLLGSSTCQPRLPTPAHATFRAHALCIFFRLGMRRRPKISAAQSYQFGPQVSRVFTEPTEGASSIGLRSCSFVAWLGLINM